MIRYHEDRLVIREADLHARLTRQRGKRKALRHITRDEARIYVQQGVVRAVAAIRERLIRAGVENPLPAAKALLDEERCFRDERGLFFFTAKGRKHYVAQH